MGIKERCCVIIVAGGKGNRMGSGEVKQFINLNNKPILAHTIDKFEENKNINDIIIVIGKDQKEYCKSNIIQRYKYKKVVALIEGGQERQDSVYNGLKSVNKNTDIVLIHDGVRPFIEQREIDTIIYTAVKKHACVLAVPVKDTIKLVNKDGIIESTLERNKLWAMQTPQVFKYDILMNAYLNAYNNNLLATDDASLVEELGEKVQVVEGNYKNIKITTKEDLEYCKFLMRGN